MTVTPFRHSMAAHCESGTVTAQLNHHGLNITEPLVFGISAGIFFAYMKPPMMDFPMFVTRSMPGKILDTFCKRTGVKFAKKNYKDPALAEKELNTLLDNNIPVSVQTDMFFMDYFPAWFRVHINVHYVNIIGRKGDKYLVSDSYFPEIAEIGKETLAKARFAGGTMAPKGLMFYPVSIPEKIDLNDAIVRGIKDATFNMLKIPLPFLGVKGIRRFGNKIVEWPGYARDSEQLADKLLRIFILLEEQGTGGGGFRYVYASFLQEAAKIMNRQELNDLSKEMVIIGDKWRELALSASKVSRSGDITREKLEGLGVLIKEKADMEEKFFTDLRKEITNKK